MLYETWREYTLIKKVEVANTDAKELTATDVLIVGEQCDVTNEAEEYY